MSIEDGAAESATPTFHKNFDEPDGDLTFVSSDNVAFRLHSKFLLFNAHGSPLTNGTASPRKLEEPAAILEILFAFLYPRRCPSVVGLEFKTLIQLAESAEKYKIFSAAGVCEHPLLGQAALYPAELLSFGVKYDYPALANQAAIHLSRVQKPLDEVLDELPEETRIAWVRYDQAWKLVFRKGRRFIARVGCQLCIAVLERWWEEIEGMTIEKLDIQTDIPDKWSAAFKLCKTCGGTENQPGWKYQLILGWANDLLKDLPVHIKQIPPFMTYMETRGLCATEIKQLNNFTFREFTGTSQNEQRPGPYRARRRLIW